jgi:GNAT superfamily N-acetyltransferase
VNIEKMLNLFDQEQRREVEFIGFRREVTPEVVRLVDRQAERGDSMVLYSRLTAANADEVIEAEIAYFESIGHDFEWKVYDHDSPADLKERLTTRGFEIGEAEAVLVLDLADAPPALLAPVNHDVSRITKPEELADVVAVQRQVWPEADFISQLGERLAADLQADPDHLSIYVAYVDELPTCSAWISFHREGSFAGLWGGSTLPQFRQRGLYTALVATRLQEAIRRGVRFLTIDASPMSHAVLQKFGFQLLTYTYPCKWRAGSSQTDGGTEP